MSAFFSRSRSLSLSQLRARVSIAPSSSRRALNFTTTSRAMVSPQTAAGEAISETAKAEGGPAKGSKSAQMQSQVGRQRNFEQAAQEVGSKMKAAPDSVTSEDAAYVKSREARATGIPQPPSDSISAEADRLAAVNEGATKGSVQGEMDPATQSAADRAENFQQAADSVASKMQSDPEHVTKEEGDLLHRREQRAFGTTSKGGIVSQAQSLASENEKKGTV